MSTYKVLNTGSGETVEQFVAGKQNYADPYTKTYTAEELQAQDNTTPESIQTNQNDTTPGSNEVETATPVTNNNTIDIAAKPKESSVWDNGFDKGMEAQPDMSIYDAIRGYNAYAKENQNIIIHTSLKSHKGLNSTKADIRLIKNKLNDKSDTKTSISRFVKVVYTFMTTSLISRYIVRNHFQFKSSRIL